MQFKGHDKGMILTRGSESVTELFCTIFENFQRNVSFQAASSINTNTNIKISDLSQIPRLSPLQLIFSSLPCFSATSEEFSVQES